jgi:hypothetical protein
MHLRFGHGAPGKDDPTLRAFYDQIRPFGLWPKPWSENFRAEHRGDLLRLLLALTWQISTFLMPMCAMLRMWPAMVTLGIVWLFTGLYLLRDANQDRTAVEHG